MRIIKTLGLLCLALLFAVSPCWGDWVPFLRRGDTRGAGIIFWIEVKNKAPLGVDQVSAMFQAFEFLRLIEVADETLQYEFAISICDEALVYYPIPLHPWVLALRGTFWMHKGDFKKAKLDFEEAVKQSPDSSSYAMLAWFLATCPDDNYRDKSKAVELANKAMELEKNYSTLDSLAAVYAEVGEFDDAIRTQKEAISLLKNEKKEGKYYKKAHKDNVTQYQKRLLSYKARKPWRTNPPRIDYDKTLKIKRAGKLVYESGGSSYRDGEYDLAIEYANEALEIYKTLKDRKYSNIAYALLGKSYRAKGNYNQAIESYEAGIRCDPNDWVMYYNLSWLLATCPKPDCRDGKRALELAQRGVSLGESSLALRALAAAYAEVGNFDEAIKTQKKAMKDHSNKEDRKCLETYKQHKPWRLVQPQTKKD
jgi:tetratricopeptide (TPR) repeat protein